MSLNYTRVIRIQLTKSQFPLVCEIIPDPHRDNIAVKVYYDE